jgi:hypothetical protein
MIGEMIWGDNNIFAENKLEALELDGVEREREREREERFLPPIIALTIALPLDDGWNHNHQLIVER